MGRALVRQPRLFLFDEPLSNLDAKLRVDMRTEIKKLHQTTKKTIVYVTHDQIEAMTLATKIAVLKGGELQQVGTPAEIYNRPSNLFVADFMGSPSMNLIEGQIKAANGTATVVLSKGKASGQSIELPVPSTVTAKTIADGQKVIFGIRPEAITDRDGADRASKAIETVDSHVEVVEPAGSDTFVVTHLGGKEVIARMRADTQVKPGDTVPFAFNLDKALLFDPVSTVRL
jgi:multiple sugar transport system ATP-binding protein